MQRIIIKNFGAIEEATIDIKKVLVLIGEQASGKSTIAKLIYFFKSLGDDWFSRVYDSNNRNFNLIEDFKFPVNEKFYDFFGSTFHLPDFLVKYFYDVNSNKYIELKLSENNKLDVYFSSDIITEDFKSKIRDVKRKLKFNQNANSSSKAQQLINETERLRLLENLAEVINKSFYCVEEDSLFTVAGRSTTVSYSDLFEKYLFADLKDRIKTTKTENKNSPFVPKNPDRSVDETLMLKFMERVSKMKDRFEVIGNFEGLKRQDPQNLANSVGYEISQSILKGDYKKDRWSEKLYLSEDNYIHLRNSSSGQQEAIRLVQDLLLAIYDKRTVLRIIEEPEAHLFPIAQKDIIKLCALLMNQHQHNQLIITTHSPYILTAFNNLLLANRVVSKDESKANEVNEIIPMEFHLKAEEFTAYALGNTYDDTKQYCEDIFNENLGIIKQNYLDTISEVLGAEFQQLLQLHKLSFA